MIRTGTKLLVVVAALLACAVSPGAAGRTGSASGVERLGSFESQVLGQINALRARHGLAALHLSTRLSAAAVQHSDQMAVRGYFAHESADGTPMTRRVGHYYAAGGYRYWSVGENLLWSSPTISPAAALRLWLGSPGHRENLLYPQWREVGLAAVHAARAPGVYDGMQVTILTTDFGVRR